MIDIRRPHVSFIMATHERCAVVNESLTHLSRCGLDRGDYEVIIVDNHSMDGTPEAISDRADTLTRLDRNWGSCAKTFGVERARGRYIIFLDDDAYPRPGAVERMIEHFENSPSLAAAGFTVHLPDGRLEGGALPGVFVGCGVGLRADALRSVGGLDVSFFMQAEEYDLVFRLAAAGWHVEMFDDLHVEHAKTASARQSDRTTYLDVRNNLRVLARYLPSPCYQLYREDCLLRYQWLAERSGHVRSFLRGTRAGLCRGVWERLTHRRLRLRSAVFERFFGWRRIRYRMARLAHAGVERVVLADMGKNIYAFYRGAGLEGIDVVAIADDRFGSPGQVYRGLPVLPVDEALMLAHDAVIVANSSPVHGMVTNRRMRERARQPVHHWSFCSAQRIQPSCDPKHPATAIQPEAALVNCAQAG